MIWDTDYGGETYITKNKTFQQRTVTVTVVSNAPYKSRAWVFKYFFGGIFEISFHDIYNN